MGEVLRYFIFIIIGLVVIFCVLFSDVYANSERTFLFQKIFKEDNYKYWTKLDGSIFCSEPVDTDSEYKRLQIIRSISFKVDIVYLTGVDLTQCAKYLPSFTETFHYYGLLIALDLEKEFSVKKIFSENFTEIKSEEYVRKFEDYSKASEWVSYIVVDNVIDGMTYSERRSLQVHLRDIFYKSFIGFRFTNTVKPTPEQKHPYRSNVSWNDFLPRDDDGDFVIVNFPVGDFRRTFIYSEEITITSNIDGQFLETKI